MADNAQQRRIDFQKVFAGLGQGGIGGFRILGQGVIDHHLNVIRGTGRMAELYQRINICQRCGFIRGHGNHGIGRTGQKAHGFVHTGA